MLRIISAIGATLIALWICWLIVKEATLAKAGKLLHKRTRLFERTKSTDDRVWLYDDEHQDSWRDR